LASILKTAKATLVRTAVAQFVHKFGGEMLLQLLQLVDFSFVLESLLVIVWTLSSYLVTLAWCVILGERCAIICFSIQSRVFIWNGFSVKVKVLEGGFGLWLGDNIAILSIIK
jgi:hypothetical protein